MKNVLLTGANGQLGKCLQVLAEKQSDIKFSFYSSAGLDITNREAIEAAFTAETFDFCINCAAYTNVEQAETASEKAFLVNATGAKNLAEVCSSHNTCLLHISTDYVFDGKASSPYLENDPANPINVYGASKLKGEELIQQTLEQYFIVRTSWLYSQFGHNFYNTILKKAEEGADLKITGAQTGTPTNANDLAQFLIEIINSGNKQFGVYHFSNSGQASWYDFAAEILKLSDNSHIKLKRDDSYQTKAKRPVYSVLSKKKLQENFGIVPQTWQESLAKLNKNSLS